ncbi:hypothetical protein ACQ5SO_08990 [Rhodovulum sp. DZ06]|uniref:hypothetical protein n=1 Tax=Rhodovulum sp. DZ06 TaxID=3425126 RepID=UPI003D3462C8
MTHTRPNPAQAGPSAYPPSGETGADDPDPDRARAPDGPDGRSGPRGGPRAGERIEGRFGLFSATARPGPTEGAEAAARAAAGGGAAGNARDAGAAGFRPDPLAAAFLQLIAHDMCLALSPETPGAAPAGNRRRGWIDLDSIYGDGRDSRGRPVGAAALRDPHSPRMMRLAGGRGDAPEGLPWINGPEDPCPLAARPCGFALAPAGDMRPPRPLLADPRNGGDPLLEKLVLAALRLHNRAALALADEGVPESDPTIGFLRAREELRLLVQWLALNAALPALAGDDALEDATDAGAPLFSRLAEREAGGIPPLPLELVAALLPLVALHRGPDGAAGADPDRLAALVALGGRAGLPSGQCVHRMAASALKLRMAPMTATEIADGPGAAALSGPLSEDTPLALYLLREAEERGDGETLGPLGAALLAETLVGLVSRDPMSYWRRPGDTGGRWRPEDGVLRRNGRPIVTLEDFIAAAED